MSGRTSLHRRRHRIVLAGAAAVLSLVGLTGCGGPEPLPAATVTVWVDPPVEAASQSTPEATPTTSQETSPVPVSLRAGHLNDAVFSYDRARELFDNAGRSVEIAEFRSPSGNIYCRLGPDFAACEVEEGRIEPPADGICARGEANDVGRLELVAGAVTPVCNTDSIRDSEAKKLAYGRVARLPGVDVTCLSEEWGVTCIDPNKEHGFFLARGSFTTF
ncbi:hypothetical protein [Intrasporangium sp.]|jgi:hypothetical protein|uniref:hypothetical protein n=1 Tax=Intrasporangium sp. TaxID=1925024 RepID=UPI003365AB47